MDFGNFQSISQITIGENQKPKQAKGGFLPALLFGVAMIIGGAFFSLNSSISRRFLNHWKSVRATVYDVEERYSTDKDGHSEKLYRPNFRYSVDGEKYEKRGIESSQQYWEGQYIEVLYNPSNPGEFSVPNIVNDLGGFALAAVGVVLIVSAGILSVKARKFKKLLNDAKSGRVEKLDGYISQVYHDSNIQSSKNGFPQNEVVIKFNDNGVEKTKTMSLFLLPEHLAGYFQNPQPIAVYRNPENPNDYLIDESEIYNLTNSIVDINGANPFRANTVIPQIPQQNLDNQNSLSDTGENNEKF